MNAKPQNRTELTAQKGLVMVAQLSWGEQVGQRDNRQTQTTVTWLACELHREQDTCMTFHSCVSRARQSARHGAGSPEIIDQFY